MRGTEKLARFVASRPACRWRWRPDPNSDSVTGQRGHITSAATAAQRGDVMKLQGKRIAVLAENMYQEMELWVPYFRFKEEGAEVKIVGAGGAKSYTSKHGYPVAVDAQAESVSAVEFDAVVVPGGYAPDLMRRHEAMVRLAREAARQGEGGAAVCHAGWVLGSGGGLPGERAASFLFIQGHLLPAAA